MIILGLILHHGSEHIIKKPQYCRGKRNNDYGSGFYCTESTELAKEWAVKDQTDGWMNTFSIDFSGMNILNLNSGEYSILHWLTILLENRTFALWTPLAVEAKKYLIREFHICIDDYDVIIGNRADDSYFTFAKDFVNGQISLRQLSYAMELGELGEQIVIKSPDVFDRLAFLGYENVSYEEWYPLRKKRDDLARKAYFDLDKNRYVRGDLYITRILDEEIKQNDPRLS